MRIFIPGLADKPRQLFHGEGAGLQFVLLAIMVSLGGS